MGIFGETLLETGIDNLLRGPGIVGIKSAGNEQRWRIHAGGNLVESEQTTLEFEVPQGVTVPIFIEIWFSDSNSIGMNVIPPNEQPLSENIATSSVQIENRKH